MFHQDLSKNEIFCAPWKLVRIFSAGYWFALPPHSSEVLIPNLDSGLPMCVSIVSLCSYIVVFFPPVSSQNMPDLKCRKIANVFCIMLMFVSHHMTLRPQLRGPISGLPIRPGCKRDYCTLQWYRWVSERARTPAPGPIWSCDTSFAYCFVETRCQLVSQQKGHQSIFGVQNSHISNLGNRVFF